MPILTRVIFGALVECNVVVDAVNCLRAFDARRVNGTGASHNTPRNHNKARYKKVRSG